MNYTDFVTRVSNTIVRSPTNPDFVAILPQCIDYAEQRLYRELNLEATTVRNSSFSLTSGNRNFTPVTSGQPVFIVVTNLNLITPAGQTNPDANIRNPLVRVSWDWLDMVYGSGTAAGIPAYWASQDTGDMAVGPTPNATYQVEAIGTVRPAPLSASNTTTVLSLYFPDLLHAAAMVFMSGWMRNFGSMSDDPKMALSWEAAYQALIGSAQAEENRKRGGPMAGG